MQLMWLIAVPALIIFLFALGAIFLPFGPPRRRWPFVLVAIINIVTVVVIMIIPEVEIGSVRDVSAGSEDSVTPDMVDAFWINRDDVEMHSCPSADCGVVGRLSFRDPVDVYGSNGSWVRISRARKALCVNGRSRFISKGSDLCDAANGIEDGI